MVSSPPPAFPNKNFDLKLEFLLFAIFQSRFIQRLQFNNPGEKKARGAERRKKKNRTLSFFSPSLKMWGNRPGKIKQRERIDSFLRFFRAVEKKSCFGRLSTRGPLVCVIQQGNNPKGRGRIDSHKKTLVFPPNFFFFFFFQVRFQPKILRYV